MKHFILSMMAMALCTAAGAQTKVTTLNANATKLNVEQLQNSEQTVQLNRYLFAGYNTLCLPVSLTAEQLAAAAKDLRLERMVAIKQVDSDLNLCFVDCTADGLQAGVPYLVYSPTKQYLRIKTGGYMNADTSLKPVRLGDDNGNEVTFSSSWELVKEKGRYGIPAQQPVTPLESVLIKTDADKNFLPTRCGFVWNQQAFSARELKIQHFTDMGAVTAITAIKTTKDTGRYGLNGQKLNSQKKGITITNGKKIVVK